MTDRFRGTYATDQQALHDAVKDAAGQRCIRCGHPNGDKQVMTTDSERVDELMMTHGNAVAHAHYFDASGDWGWRVVVLEKCDKRCTHRQDGKMRVLTVHHLDGNKSNNAWWNLLALCQGCHLQVQANVIPERPFLFTHTPWFRPYACGFYAHYYGKVEITREQADADPDRWLKLGQPWLYQTDGASG